MLFVFITVTAVRLLILSFRYRFQDQNNRTRWQEDQVTDMVSFCPGLLLMPLFCWNCTSDFISESTYEFVLKEPLYDSNHQQVNSSSVNAYLVIARVRRSSFLVHLPLCLSIISYFLSFHLSIFRLNLTTLKE